MFSHNTHTCWVSRKKGGKNEVPHFGLVLAPRLKKRIPSNLGDQFTALGANVPAFISNLGSNLQPKYAQSWPQVFLGPYS